VDPRFLYSIGEGKLFDERGPVISEEIVVEPSSRPRGVFSEPSDRARRRARRRALETEHPRDEEEPWRTRSGWGKEVIDFWPAQRAYGDLRGGTQLVRVGAEGWLGIGHKMTFIDRKKLYWHVWYLVDAHGKMRAASPPMKLASNGIEFAAGMGVDGDRVVVSFGVDDMQCKIGETSLSAVLGSLQEIGG
jgi:hypothetical protein